jgi:RNA-binding protein
MTGSEKRGLRSRAQRLAAVVRVGHAGLTDGVVAALDQAFTATDLVKVKFDGQRESRHEIAPAMAERTGSTVIQELGHVAVFFRPLPAAREA